MCVYDKEKDLCGYRRGKEGVIVSVHTIENVRLWAWIIASKSNCECYRVVVLLWANDKSRNKKEREMRDTSELCELCEIMSVREIDKKGVIEFGLVNNSRVLSV